VERSKFKGLRLELEALEHHVVPLTRGRIQALLLRYKTKSGLNDLSLLQTLHIDFGVALTGPGLTDIGGYFGLATANPDMKRMIVKPSPRITGKCAKIVKSAFSPAAIISFPYQ
jgi:hypothetical protein